MNNPPPPSDQGIEVVELSDIDLDFAIEQMFQQGAARPLETTRTEMADAEEIRSLDVFHGLSKEEISKLVASSKSIQAVAGHVLVSPGRLNTKVFFVVEGQLRLYAPNNDRRPVAIVDVGHCTGLRSALTMQPAQYAVIATEISNILEVDIKTIEELTKQSHTFALHYTSLLASYVRGDNCFYVGARAPKNARQGYIDELTLLHNQHWLDTMLPRLISRFRLVDKPLSLVAFAADGLGPIAKEHGMAAGLRVLEAIGHWVLNHTRPIDILAINRGGCVFAFLPDSDLEAARHLADRLKNAIPSVPVNLASPKATAPITVTLSFGITSLEKGMKENDFVNKAETLVKKSMSLGGNQINEIL